MLIPRLQLIDRVRARRDRAKDLAQLRALFAAARAAGDAGPEAVAASWRLRRFRREMAQLLVNVETCAGCARGHPEPAGRWDGGHCCGGHTLRLFTPLEVATLKLGGTTLRDLRPPSSASAGCAFRGEYGCSLEPEDRPNICLQYVCAELRTELRKQPRWRGIKRLRRAMMKELMVLSELLPGEPLTPGRRSVRHPRAGC